MKKFFTTLVIIILIFTFVASCKRQDDVIIYPNGKTETGIWIVDHKKSVIKKKDFNIIETDDSDAFSEIGYCSEYFILYVKFRSSHEAYIYCDFDEYDWKQFRKAPSLGAWFNQHIKGKYDCYKW